MLCCQDIGPEIIIYNNKYKQKFYKYVMVHVFSGFVVFLYIRNSCTNVY